MHVCKRIHASSCSNSSSGSGSGDDRDAREAKRLREQRAKRKNVANKRREQAGDKDSDDNSSDGGSNGATKVRGRNAAAEQLAYIPAVGDMVALPEGADKFCLALIAQVDGTSLQVEYFGTQGDDPQTARFKPVWIDREDGRPVFTRRRRGKYDRWSGEVQVSWVLCGPLELKKQGALKAKSYDKLKDKIGHLKHAKME